MTPLRFLVRLAFLHRSWFMYNVCEMGARPLSVEELRELLSLWLEIYGPMYDNLHSRYGPNGAESEFLLIFFKIYHNKSCHGNPYHIFNPPIATGNVVMQIFALRARQCCVICFLASLADVFGNLCSCDIWNSSISFKNLDPFQFQCASNWSRFAREAA